MAKMIDKAQALALVDTLFGDPILKMAAKAVLNKCPEVEAEPVVRCEECKKFVQMGDTPRSRVCIRPGGLSMAKPEDFCPYGRRRNDGN